MQGEGGLSGERYCCQSNGHKEISTEWRRVTRGGRRGFWVWNTKAQEVELENGKGNEGKRERRRNVCVFFWGRVGVG